LYEQSDFKASDKVNQYSVASIKKNLFYRELIRLISSANPDLSTRFWQIQISQACSAHVFGEIKSRKLAAYTFLEKLNLAGQYGFYRPPKV
jgi:hypothetical protein